MRFLITLLTMLMIPLAGAAPLQVICSVPEVGAIARQIGGDQVAVTVCVKPREDPHSLEARPSLIRDMASADVWIQVGLELEVGWAPKLLEKSRNPRLQPGSPGFIDVSQAVANIHRHDGPVDRSMGDVHPAGNPHYLLDPVNGMRAADLIADRLSVLRPAQAAAFEERRKAFRAEIGAALVGESLAKKYDAEKLAVLEAAGTLTDFLRASHESAALGGWCAQLAPYRERPIVVDHDAWGYFTERFGLQADVFLEPKPGMAPTTRHLATVIQEMKARKLEVIVASPYFPARHHQFVVKATGARVAPLAHQCDSRPGTSTYREWIQYNVSTLADACGGATP